MGVHVSFTIFQVLIIVYCIVQVSAGKNPDEQKPTPPKRTVSKPGAPSVAGKPATGKGKPQPALKNADPKSKTKSKPKTATQDKTAGKPEDKDKQQEGQDQEDASENSDPAPATDNGTPQEEVKESSGKDNQDNLNKKESPEEKDKQQEGQGQKDASKKTDPAPATENSKAKEEAKKPGLKGKQTSFKKEGSPEDKNNKKEGPAKDQTSKAKPATTKPADKDSQQLKGVTKPKRGNANGNRPKKRTGGQQNMFKRTPTRPKDQAAQAANQGKPVIGPVEDKAPQPMPQQPEPSDEQPPDSGYDQPPEPVEDHPSESGYDQPPEPYVQQQPVIEEDPIPQPPPPRHHPFRLNSWRTPATRRYEEEDPGNQNHYASQILPNSGLHHLLPHHKWAYMNPESLGPNFIPPPVPQYPQPPPEYYSNPAFGIMPQVPNRGPQYEMQPPSYEERRREYYRTSKILEYLKQLSESQRYNRGMYY